MTQHAHQTGWVVGVALVLFIASASPADEFDNQHQQLVKETPKGLTLNLSLEKQTFRIGEVIPITLKYVSIVPGYALFARNYDRSGRLNTLRFTIDGPAGGWMDPLKDYFSHGLFMGGGLGGFVDLGEYQHEFELNQWVRFDKPGTYRVYCTSYQAHSGTFKQQIGVTIVSDVVEFKIIEIDAALIQQTLHAAKVYLNSPNRGDPSRGAELLRYLGTHEAVDSLVSALGDQNTSAQALMGLVSARDRVYAIEALNRAMADPFIAKNETYLRAQSELSRPVPTTEPSAKP